MNEIIFFLIVTGIIFILLTVSERRHQAEKDTLMREIAFLMERLRDRSDSCPFSFSDKPKYHIQPGGYGEAGTTGKEPQG
jgi:hypothetical protein